ncbi:hypothetical protein BCV71DRAFT_172471 [Rhizopus microsporus]|uniref:C2 domain-containing protein n=1 Tax=Rhizopus microsporus TaxID=58291 RepID=A0A1X0SD08_RHIZD|nr:hypothetical protein BCV71DRAFT_172471 [Rhizopus microsporus]
MQQSQSLLGELVVVALKAAASKQDPFCIFRVNEVVKRTKTDYGGGSYPIWDDQVNIPIRQGQHRLHVQIFDKEANARNLMGEGVVDLTKVLREREHDGYFPVKYQGKHGGEIYLELTFYPIVR